MTAAPDTAEVTTGVLGDGATSGAALAKNAGVVQRLIAAVRQAGVPASAIRTAAVRVRPLYRRDTDGDETSQVTGFRATNQLVVRLSRAADAGPVIDALAGAGATDIDGPNLGFADEAPLLARARAQAVAAAERQARDYAAALGLKTLRPLRVSERSGGLDGAGEIVVTGNRRTAIEPGEREVTATVWIDYAAAR